MYTKKWLIELAKREIKEGKLYKCPQNRKQYANSARHFRNLSKLHD